MTDFDDEDGDDMESAYDELDEDGGGIFRDNESIFDNKPVNQANPVETRQQEQERMYRIHTQAQSDNAPVIEKDRAQDHAVVVRNPQTLGGAGKRELKARFDGNGRPWVAWFENGRAMEGYREPSQNELVAIARAAKDNRFLAGGIGVVDEAPAQQPPSGGFPVKKVIIGGAILAVVAVGGYYVYRHIKADEDTDVDEVD